MSNKAKILITMRENGENGGPFVSHKRIMESQLNLKYNFSPLIVPRSRKLINPYGMYKFVKKIRETKPDIVHVAGLQLDGFLLMVACNLAKVKTVLAIHGSTNEALCVNEIKRKIITIIENYTVKKADIVYGVSDYVSSWPITNLAKNYYGTIYNITNISDEPINSIKNILNFSDDDIVVVSTGRIITEKGFDILWDAIRSVGKDNNIKYVIAGEGIFKEELEKKIIAEGYDNKVFLIGYQSDIASILNGADIFVICTKHETLCISLLEAGYAGLPLIATNVGGIPEIIEDGVEGYLVENLSAESFAYYIKLLANNQMLRVKMGAAAKAKIINKFSKDSILEKLDEIYQILLLDKK